MAQLSNIGVSFFFSVLYGKNNSTTGTLVLGSGDRLEATTRGWHGATQFLPEVVGPEQCAFYHTETSKYLSVSASTRQIEASQTSINASCMFLMQMPLRGYNQFSIRTFDGRTLRIETDGATSIVLADGKGESPFYVVPAFLGFA